MVAANAEVGLWARLQDGDVDAFTALYDLHAQRVFNHCFRRMLSRPDAEDLTAEVFVLAWRRRADIRLVDSAGGLPWLLVTANHMMRRHHSKATRARRLLSTLPVDPGETADHAELVVDRLDDKYAIVVIATVLQKLSRRDRDVVQLCVIEGLTPSEVAAASGEPASSVRSRLSRALGRARIEYDLLTLAAPNIPNRRIAQ